MLEYGHFQTLTKAGKYWGQHWVSFVSDRPAVASVIVPGKCEEQPLRPPFSRLFFNVVAPKTTGQEPKPWLHSWEVVLQADNNTFHLPSPFSSPSFPPLSFRC